jgi:hypothetical protein
VPRFWAEHEIHDTFSSLSPLRQESLRQSGDTHHFVCSILVSPSLLVPRWEEARIFQQDNTTLNRKKRL